MGRETALGQTGQTGPPDQSDRSGSRSSGVGPDHPDLLSAENHCLAGSSGVTQDDPTLCREIVLTKCLSRISS